MVNIPSTTAVSPSQATSSTPTLTPVAGSPTALPDKLQQVLQQLQLTGTIAEPPNGAELTLNTVVGELTVLLPQLMDEKQSQLMQQLLAMFQTQKPITIAVQPGNPPTQIFLLLPTTSGSTAATATSASANNLAAQLASLQAKPMPIVPGASLPAIVLPPDISLPTTGSPLPGQLQAQAPNTLPQSYASPTYNVLPSGVASPSGAPITPPLPATPSLIPTANITPTLPENVVSDELAVQNLLPTNLSAPQSPPPLQISLPSAPSVTITPPTTGQLPSSPVATTPLSGSLPGQGVSAAATPTETLLQPGSEVIVRVVAVSSPASPPLVPQGPNQILATVVASGPNGEPIIKAGDQTFYIRQSGPLPPGTNLLVTLTPVKAETVMTLMPPDAHNLVTFQQIVEALSQISPQLAQQVITSSIPQPNAMLPATLLFLMSAFKQGNTRNWLGDDATDALIRAGKTELIVKLTQELDSFAQPVREPVVGEWQSYPIPFYNQGQMQLLNFHVHGDGGKGQDKDAAGKSRPAYLRFLIDFNLSRLGPMQFDGFLRKKQLDLIVRSEHTLPEGLHRELRQLYAKSMGVIDYAGSLNFQVGRHNWLNIQKTPSKAVVT